MLKEKKYLTLTLTLITIFAYLTFTEVTSRWQSTMDEYSQFQQKRREVLNPEALAEKKLDLLARKNALGEMLTKGLKEYEQSETGLIEYLNAGAKLSGIRFESLTPFAADSKADVSEIGFKIDFISDYHHTGAFVNAIETGAMMVRCEKINLALSKEAGKNLHISVEGSTYILSPKRIDK